MVDMKRIITCVLAGIDYLVHPQVLGIVEERVVGDSLLPVLLLSESELNAGPAELRKTLDSFVERDDVCTEEFTAILVVKPAPPPSTLQPSGAVDRHANSSTKIYRLSDNQFRLRNEDLPSGPYFLSGRSLHQAWRLYSDNLESFEFGMIPDDVSHPTEYTAVSSLTQDGTSLGIPVPSRHYYRRSPDKPLAGVRVGLNDIVDVRGVKTTVSSRSYSQLYPVRENHSSFAERLIKTGAVIVGKTKTSQFATETLWIDFHRPRNPRGDQYQEPSGSSTGGASALAGYQWLDHSIAGDSSEGIREPSTWHGLFGIRPTFGSSSLKGVAINSPRYDTIGMFGRCLEELYKNTQTTLSVNSDSGNTIRRILYPLDFYPVDPPEYQELTEEFVSALEKSLRVTRTKINLAEIWSRDPPHGAGGTELQEYMDKAPFLSLCYDYNKQYQPFVDEYRMQFGRDPFVEDSTSVRWGIGANITSDEYDEHLKRIKVFKTWFSEKVMAASGPLADSVMVLPYGSYEPSYSNVLYGPPLIFKGVDPRSLAPILGTPHVVAPFSQVPYESHISKRVEYRPICGTLMGAPGTDLMLIRTMHDVFKVNKWRDYVDTGRFTFPVGNNSRNVDDSDVSREKPLVVQTHVSHAAELVL